MLDDFYSRLGKVRNIPHSELQNDVYKHVRDALLPQVVFVIGPKASGKSAIAQRLAERSNMNHIDFKQFLAQNDLEEDDDETVCLELISQIAQQHEPRVVLDNFPSNLYQAKFFVRNYKVPANVFSLECDKDICQERMQQLGENHESYVESAVLSQQIKDYNQGTKELLPYLSQVANLTVVNTGGSLRATFAKVDKAYEPTIIHIRPGPNSNDLRKEIAEKLEKEHGFANLDIHGLMKLRQNPAAGDQD